MNYKFSALELYIILFNTTFGAALMTLPRRVKDVAMGDIWLSVLLGGLVTTVAVIVALKLSEYFPRQICIEYHCTLLGPMLGQLANCVLIVILISILIATFRTVSAAIKLFLFDLTPLPIIVFSLLLVAAYAGQYGAATHIRVQKFLFFVTHPAFIGIILLGVLAVDSDHYKPFLAEGLMPVIKGIVPTWGSYAGGVLIIGLIYPFLTNPGTALKSSLWAYVTVTMLTTTLVFIVQGILGVEDIGRQIFPTIIAYRVVEISDVLLERVDGLLISFWLYSFFTSLSSYLHFTAFAVSRMLRLGYSRSLLWLQLPVVLLGCLMPPSVIITEKAIEWSNVIGTIWGLAVLPCLLALAWLRGKKTCG